MPKQFSVGDRAESSLQASKGCKGNIIGVTGASLSRQLNVQWEDGTIQQCTTQSINVIAHEADSVDNSLNLPPLSLEKQSDCEICPINHL